MHVEPSKRSTTPRTLCLSIIISFVLSLVIIYSIVSRPKFNVDYDAVDEFMIKNQENGRRTSFAIILPHTKYLKLTT